MFYQTTKKITLLVLIAALALCFSSKVFAAKPDKAREKEKAAPAAKEAPEAAAPKYDPKEVIAKVGDNVLTREKVNWMQQDAPPEIVKKIADWWIETELLYKAAVKSDDMFKDEMDKYMFELQYKKMYVVKLVEQLQAKDFDISDKEAKEYYEKNKATNTKLQTLGQATFYHIECDTLEKAQAVLEKLKAGGDIKELAKTESIAKDAKQGGYIRKIGFGVIQRRFSPEIAEQVEKAEPNKLIGPLENRTKKFEIISVESVKPTKILSFERARKKIDGILLGKKRTQYFEDYRENLKKDNAKKMYRSPILDEPAEDKESAETKEKEKK